MPSLDITYQFILAGLGATAGAVTTAFIARIVSRRQLGSLRRQLAASESSRVRAQELLKQARQQANHLFRQQELARLAAGESPPTTRPSGFIDLPEVRVFGDPPPTRTHESRHPHVA
jgi:hypothetical protein